jgi:prepilin-type N-terminal cleavage/methylation domain-containing protein/prepilin-type processing-associated H-X9-DG protein
VSKSAKKGFTLIELLVVIAIIALLLSILTPALNKVKEQAREITCRSNIKQLAVALEVYSVNYDNKSLVSAAFLPGDPTVCEPTMWFLLIAPYMGDNKYTTDPTSVLEGAMEILWCPSTKKPVEETGGSWGTPENRWRFHGAGLGGEGSYGLNTWIGGMDYDTQMPPPLGFGYINKRQVKACSFRDTLPGRADIPVFADSVWMGGIPMDVDQSKLYNSGWPPQNPPPYTNDPGYTGDALYEDAGMRRFCIDRHSMGINVSFVDGHAQKVRLENLWSLKWNRTFQTIDHVKLK